MRLRLENITNYSYRREIRFFTEVFSLTARSWGKDPFTQKVIHFFENHDLRDHKPEFFLQPFRALLRRSREILNSPLRQEILRWDWFCYKTNSGPQTMMTFYPIDELIEQYPGPNKRLTHEHIKRHKEPLYFAFSENNRQVTHTRLTKIEYQLANWLLRGASKDSIKNKITTLKWPIEKVNQALYHLKSIGIE